MAIFRRRWRRRGLHESKFELTAKAKAEIATFGRSGFAELPVAALVDPKSNTTK